MGDQYKITNKPPSILNFLYGDVIIKGPGGTYRNQGDVLNILSFFMGNRDNIHVRREIDRQMAIVLANYINENDSIKQDFINELLNTLKEKQSHRRPRTKKRIKYKLDSILDTMHFEAQANPKRKQTGVAIGDVFYALKYDKGSKGSLFHLYDQGWKPKPGKYARRGIIKPIEPFKILSENKKLIRRFNTLYDNIVNEHPEIFKNVLTSINIGVIVKNMAKDRNFIDMLGLYGYMFEGAKKIEKNMFRYLLKKMVDNQMALAATEMKSNMSADTLSSLLADTYGDNQANVIINSIFSDEINVKKQTVDSQGYYVTKDLNISGPDVAGYIMEFLSTSMSTLFGNEIVRDYNRYLSMAMSSISNLQFTGDDVYDDYEYYYKLNKRNNFLVEKQKSKNEICINNALMILEENQSIKKILINGSRSQKDIVEKYLNMIGTSGIASDFDKIKDGYYSDMLNKKNRILDSNKENLKESLKEDIESYEDQTYGALEYYVGNYIKANGDYVIEEVNTILKSLYDESNQIEKEERMRENKIRKEERIKRKERELKMQRELEKSLNTEPEIDFDAYFSDEDMKALDALETFEQSDSKPEEVNLEFSI